MPVYCSCTSWTPGSSWKGPVKCGLSICAAACPCGFLELDFWFFCMVVQNQEKLNVDSIIFEWTWSKIAMAFSSSGPKICCILRVNLWIELISWMLIVMQQFLVRLISYSLTFKCCDFTEVVLLARFWICNIFCNYLSLMVNSLSKHMRNCLWFLRNKITNDYFGKRSK